MSDSVKPEAEEEWRRSQCTGSSRTRPILIGQYPSSVSPSVLNSPPPPLLSLNEETTGSDHLPSHNHHHTKSSILDNNDPAQVEEGKLSPPISQPPKSTTKDNVVIIGVKDETNSASNIYSSSGSTPPSVKFCHGRTPDSPKNIKTLTTKNGRHGKEAATIPVGIAVAWQRLVTSASSTLSTTDTTTTTTSCCAGTVETEKGTTKSVPHPKASPNNHHHISKGKLSPNSPCSSPSLPKRPLSASSAPGIITTKERGDMNNKNKHLSKVADVKSPHRPASVNSIPIQQSPHHPHGMSALQNNLSAFLKQQQQQYALSGLNSPYTDWPPGHLNVPHTYIQQQLSLHHQQQLQQLQLSHSGHYGPQQLAHPHAGYPYHGYSSETLQKYEQYLQQSELHRHHQELQYHHQLHQHQQQQLQQEYDIRRATPIPSPRINIPSPSPTIHPGQSMWPPEFFHQNSSTALSPKSLTSTPSPVLVQDSTTSHYLMASSTNPSGGRRSTTPTNSTTMTTSSHPGSNNNHGSGGKNVSFSPVLPPKKSASAWKEVKISPVPKKVTKKYEEEEDRKGGSPMGSLLDVSKLEEEVVREERDDGKKTLAGKKHDFSKLESLIEKRDEVSVPLLNQQQNDDGDDEQEDDDIVADDDVGHKNYFDNKNEKSYPEKYGDYSTTTTNTRNITSTPDYMNVKFEATSGASDGSHKGSPEIEIKKEVNRCDVVVDGVCKQVPETKAQVSLLPVVTQSKLLTNSTSTPPPLTTCSSAEDTPPLTDSTPSLIKLKNKRNDKKALNSGGGGIDMEEKGRQRSPHKSTTSKRNKNNFHSPPPNTKCIYDGDIDEKRKSARDNDMVNNIRESTSPPPPPPTSTASKLNRDIKNSSSTPTVNVKDKITENINTNIMTKQEVEPLEYESKNISIYCGSKNLLYNNHKKTLHVFAAEEKSDATVNDTNPVNTKTSARTKLMENYNSKESFSSSLSGKRERSSSGEIQHQLTTERTSLQNNEDNKIIGRDVKKPVTSRVENESFQYRQPQHIPTGSNSVKKCDNDIKVRAGLSCLNSISDNSSLVYSRPTTNTNTTTTTTIKKEEMKKQDNQQLTDAYHHQHHSSEIGNRSYQLLNVPLPPPPPHVPVDRKLIFKAETKQQQQPTQNPGDTMEKKLQLEHHNTLLLSQRFQHHFLPIEQEHNHLNLLATVAQEFGNEIGLSGSLIKAAAVVAGQNHELQQQQQQSPVVPVDTYEFVEDVQEKIGTFSQSQLALNTSRPSKINKTKLKSISQTSSSTSPSHPVNVPLMMMPSLTTDPSPVSQSQMIVPPTVSPIVLKIPHITPSDRQDKKKKRNSQPKSTSSPSSDKKLGKKRGEGQLTIITPEQQQQQVQQSSQKSRKRASPGTTPRKIREPKEKAVGKEKVVKGSRKKGTVAMTTTKMTIISDNNQVTNGVTGTVGDDDNHLMIKVKRKSKKQTVQNVFVERKNNNVELKDDVDKEAGAAKEEGLPLNLEKMKSTSDVMKKGPRPSNLVTFSNLQLQNQSKDDKSSNLELLVLPQVQKIVVGGGDKPSLVKQSKSSLTPDPAPANTGAMSNRRNKLLSLSDGQSTNKMLKSRRKPSEKPNALSQDLTLLQNNNNNAKNKMDKNTNKNNKRNSRKEKAKISSTTNTFNLNTKNERKRKNTGNSKIMNNSGSNNNNLLLTDDNYLKLHNGDKTRTGHSVHPNNNILSFKNGEDHDMTTLRIEDCQLFSPTPSSTTSNVENDWAANPTYAVTAIKTHENDESDSLVSSTSPVPPHFSSSTIHTPSDPYSLDQDDTHSSVSSSSLNNNSSKKDKRKSAKPSKLSKLTLMNVKNVTHNNESSATTLKPTTTVHQEHHLRESELFQVKSQLKSFVHFSPRKSKSSSPSKGHHHPQRQQQYHIKPCLKAEPIRRTATSPEGEDYISDEEKDVGIENIDLISTTTTKLYSNTNSHLENSTLNSRRMSSHHEDKVTTTTTTSGGLNFGERNGSTLPPESVENGKEGEKVMNGVGFTDIESLHLDKVVIESVAEMQNDMRILTEIQGLFYTGKLNALQPPDVYGVTLDNERGAPPHLIFSAEEVLEKCIREVKPPGLVTGLRICAYWSKNYSGLYPGKVSVDYIPTGDPHNELIPIEFDDGDTGVIKLNEIRLLAADHPIREYDPNPLLTLEKKHRKRRHSSATGSQSGCSGDHEDPDCGEAYCAKVGKFEETEEKHRSSHLLYWSWKGLGYKKPRSKKDRNKEFFDGIQRGDEVVNVGDSALFISSGNERPFIGRVEKFWEKKGQKIVSIRWFYHPEEVKTNNRRLQGLKYAGALFESPHIDENDVQTIARKCEVLPFNEFKELMSPTTQGTTRPKRLSHPGDFKETKDGKEKVGCLTKWSNSKNTSQKGVYYIAGFYDPYTYNLQLKDLK